MFGVQPSMLKFGKKEFRRLTLAKKYILDVSATTVAFFSKDKKCKCLTASCLEYVHDV